MIVVVAVVVVVAIVVVVAWLLFGRRSVAGWSAGWLLVEAVGSCLPVVCLMFEDVWSLFDCWLVGGWLLFAFWLCGCLFDTCLLRLMFACYWFVVRLFGSLVVLLLFYSACILHGKRGVKKHLDCAGAQRLKSAGSSVSALLKQFSRSRLRSTITRLW